MALIYCNNCSEVIDAGEFCDASCSRQFAEMEAEYFDAQYRAELLNERSFEDRAEHYHEDYADRF